MRNAADGIQDKDEYQEANTVAKDAKEHLGNILNPVSDSSPPQQIEAFRREYSEILTELDKPFVVVIDNLDRCLPTNAIHILEAIRLFLFLPNTAFIIAADEEMIRTSVANYFKGASNRHQIDYIDKLIQVPIRVPKAGVREVRSYLYMLYAIDFGITDDRLDTLRSGLENALQQSWKENPISRQDALALTGESENSELESGFSRADRIAPILANSPIIHGNPRIVKRLLNVVKMRSKIAKRRSMPLDEAVITKLVIFERCVGTEATAEFYRLVDSEKGKPALLKELENNNGEMPDSAPKTWTNDPTTKSFITEWAQLEPKLGKTDLRAAIYLSRETMPIGAYVVGLSVSGRKVLEVLVDTAKKSSPTASEVVLTLPKEENVSVMEGIISHLRQVSDWTNNPKGFAGGCLLAEHSEDAAEIFIRYVKELESSDSQSPWMKAMLKDEPWYGED